MKSQSDKKEARRLYRRIWMRNWTRKNRVLLNKIRCQRRKKNPELAARHRARSRRYYHANRNKIILKMREYRRCPINSQRAVQCAKAWQIKNPERNRLCQRIAERRRRNSVGKYTIVDIHIMMIKQKNKCVYCSTNISKKFHVDHKTPIKKGGTHWPRNLQLTCPPCNHRKSAKTHREFLTEIRRKK